MYRENGLLKRTMTLKIARGKGSAERMNGGQALKWKRFLVLLAVPALLLCGCSERSEVENAYDVFGAQDTYSAVVLSDDEDEEADDGILLFAQDLCVGGLENTESEDVIADCAEAAAVFSLATGEITYAQNIYETLYPASTTKILTAYIALKYGNLDDEITVSQEAIDELAGTGSSTCGLTVGDTVTLRDLLYGLLLRSGNDAANVIAEYISGSTDEFAELMNEEAAALGATGSHFVNANGLPDEDHYTTVYDLYLILNAAIQDETFVEIISSTAYQVTLNHADGTSEEGTWTNTNGYLSGTYEEPEGISVIGGKTGTTTAAGYCLVLYSENESGDPVISIVLKGNTRSDMYKLMTQVLENFGN